MLVLGSDVKLLDSRAGRRGRLGVGDGVSIVSLSMTACISDKTLIRDVEEPPLDVEICDCLGIGRFGVVNR